VGEIGKIYNTLARIVTQEGKTDEARVFRRQAREAMVRLKGTPYLLRPHPLHCRGGLSSRPRLSAPDAGGATLEELIITRGRGPLVAAIRRVLNGERDADALCEALDAVLPCYHPLRFNDMRGRRGVKTSWRAASGRRA
jgi:hypothetical protein